VGLLGRRSLHKLFKLNLSKEKLMKLKAVESISTRVNPMVSGLWRKNCDLGPNFLSLTDKTLEESLEKCPPKEYKGAIFLGRYYVPWFMVRMEESVQPRDKTNDQTHSADLKNDFLTSGFLFDKCNPPPAAFDPTNPEILKGLGGFHREPVLKEIGQSFYMFDVYDFTHFQNSEYNMRVAASNSNWHGSPAKTQTKQDYIKEVAAAVEAGLVDRTPEAIREAVEDFVGNSKTKNVKDSIADIVSSNSDAYANFRTYSSNSSHAKYTIKSEFSNQGIVPAGVENRTPEQIEEQGYISYSAAQGDNMSTWMRGIINSAKYRVPCYVFGYSDKRVSDLKQFREEWIEDFNKQRNYILHFIERLLGESLPDDLDMNDCDVRVGGFLPQHIKRNPVENGAPTETTIVDIDGVKCPFDYGAGGPVCLSLGHPYGDYYK
jgi:hypothetical protein